MLSVNVFALIHEFRVKCASKCFDNDETGHSYALVVYPIVNNEKGPEPKTKVILPLLFDPQLSKQIPNYVTAEEDKKVVLDRIDTEEFKVLFIPDMNVSFEITIEEEKENKPDLLESIANSGLGLFPTPDRYDEAIKQIDHRIIELIWEQFDKELHDNSSEITHENIIYRFIRKTLKSSIAISNIPVEFLDKAPTAVMDVLTPDDYMLASSFSSLIQAFGKTNIVKQDIVNSLCDIIHSGQFTKELYDDIKENQSFKDSLSADIRNEIYNSVVLACPLFFDEKSIKSSANYYYWRKEISNAIILFEALEKKLNEISGSERDLAETYNSLGCCYVNLLEFEKANNAFSKAIETVKNYAPAYNNWAFALLTESETVSSKQKRDKLLKDAWYKIHEAIRFDSKDVSYISNKAFIEYESGDYPQVLSDLKNARELTSKYNDFSTLLKLSIDARIQNTINEQGDQHVEFSDFIDDLTLIYQNERDHSKYYFEALKVYNEAKKTEDKEKLRETTNALLLFEFYVSELLSSVTIHDPKQDIYFYTNLGSLQRILSDENDVIRHRLQLFNVNHMNDPREGKEFENTLLNAVSNSQMAHRLYDQNPATTTHRKRLDTDFVFLKSFTKNDDSLPMWIHYADFGKGCCVKVSKNLFANFSSDLSGDDRTLTTNPFDNEYRLYSVLYVKDGKLEKPISSTVEKNFKKAVSCFRMIDFVYNKLRDETKELVLDAIKSITRKIRYLFKSADYAYEQEMRIVVYRPVSHIKRDDSDIKMTPVSDKYPIPKVFVYTAKGATIEEIIFGPKVVETDDVVPFYAKKLLEMHNYEEEKVIISKSEIEYR